MTTPNMAAVTKRFEVRNLAEGEADVYLYNAIGDTYDGVTAVGFIKAVTGLGDVKKLNLYINSPGGSVYDADAIVNFLNRHPAEKVANVDGVAASAACTVAMACPTRNIAANAMMMVHRVADFAFGNSDEMRKTADVLDKLDKCVCDAYAAATGQTADKCRQLMDDETWMGAEEAKALGFATAIVGEKKAAALAGMSAASLAKLGYKHTDKLASLMVSGGEANTTGQTEEPANHKDPAMAKDTKTGDAPAAGAEPINLAEQIKAEGKRYKEAFGPENGAKYLADGLSFPEAQAQYSKDLAATNKAQADQIADLTTRLDAANKALGVDPLSADVSDPGGDGKETPEQAKYGKLLKAFNGDEKRAKKAFDGWKAQQAKKGK
jgi:ATP-dependent Clp protease, protease subunit